MEGGCHFGEAEAEEAVERIRYTDKGGTARTGAHWSMEQVRSVTSAMKFPEGTTDWDKYVAFNSFYADMNKVLTEDLIVKGAWAFYFADEDAPHGKVKRYVKAMEG